MTDSLLQRPSRLRSTQLVTSRDNPLVQRLRRLSQDPVAYRKQGEVWLEGDHLCEACLQRDVEVGLAVVAETAWLGEHGMAAGTDAHAARLSALARDAEQQPDGGVGFAGSSEPRGAFRPGPRFGFQALIQGAEFGHAPFYTHRKKIAMGG